MPAITAAAIPVPMMAPAPRLTTPILAAIKANWAAASPQLVPVAAPREDPSHGSGLRRIELFSSSPLVGLQEEFNPLVARENRVDAEDGSRKEGKGRRPGLVLPMLGRDDLLL